MVKRLTVFLIFSIIFAGYSAYDLRKEVKEWEPYVKLTEDEYSLKYTYESGNYSQLYEYVYKNNLFNVESKYDIFAYFHNQLVLTAQKKLNSLDFEKELNDLKKLYSMIDADMLNKADELLSYYGFKD